MSDDMILQRVDAEEVHGHTRRRTLMSGRTQVQAFEIAEIGAYGRALLLDGCLQSTEHDEHVYHEALIFPAYAHAPEVRRVLCLGGSSGGVLKRVLKMPGVECVLLIDVDRELHEWSRRLLPHAHEDSLADPRVRLRFGDPVALVHDLGEAGRFDLILADLPDATADCYARALFTEGFYRLVKRLLAPRGVYATQAGLAHFRNCRFLNRVLRTLRQAFLNVAPYTITVPSYGAPWGFALASDDIDFAGANEADLERRLQALPPGTLTAYDLQTHRHAFNLPRALRARLSEPLPVITPDDLEVVRIAVPTPLPDGG